MLYSVKDEFIDLWAQENMFWFLTQREVEQVCRRWGKKPEEVSHQLNHLPAMKMYVVSSEARGDERYSTFSSSARVCASHRGMRERDETVTLYANNGKPLDRVKWNGSKYVRVSVEGVKPI